MPESLQQKVDRMTAGMEVTVTFGDRAHPCTVRGETWMAVDGYLYVGDDAIRVANGKVNPRITSIDMPEPECPYSEGDRLLSASLHEFTATGSMVWCEECGTWDVEGKNAGEPYTARALKAPVTLVALVPAESDRPAILVTYTDGSVEAKKRGEHGKNYGGLSLNWWLTSSGVATVQALRPAEYLRGGE